jgi:RTX calcium-binding nonapeptide repeat (4 copies)
MTRKATAAALAALEALLCFAAVAVAATVTGDDDANRVKGGRGEDELDGGAGDDRIDARGDGRHADTVTCGEGEDTVRLGRGDTADDSCEQVKAPKAKGPKEDRGRKTTVGEEAAS